MEKETILKILRKRLKIKFDKKTYSEWLNSKFHYGEGSSENLEGIINELKENNGWVQLKPNLSDIADEIIKVFRCSDEQLKKGRQNNN